MKTNLNKLLSLAVVLFTAGTLHAQNTFPATGSVGIGTTTPNATSIFEVKSTTKGVLLPRMTSAQKSAIASPVTGLLIYQTDGTTGLYNYTGSKWKAVTSAAWNLAGNSGTTASQFIGTTDSVALNFKVYNQKAGRISPAGIVFLGFKAGNSNTTGTYNTGIGYIALSSNTIGYNNTACGAGALNLNTEGYNNTANGLNALYSNTTGYSNTVNGYAALSLNTTGYENIANGVGALFNNTTGNANTAIGTIAGNGNTIGTYNTFVGYNAQGAATLFNSTAIGAGAYVATNNSLVLGNNVNVGIGNSSPTAKLHIGVSGLNAYQGLAITNTLSGGKTITINQGVLGKLNFTEPGVTDLFTMDFNTQRVGIGTSAPAYKLDVCGVIRSNEVRVEIGWCDYVFNDDYKLPALSDVEAFIKANKHLPDVTKGSIIETEGLEVGKASAQMIRKIEELTLYVIDLQKQVDELKKNNK